MINQSVLHNIRVLDFTWVLAGPYATRLLADFGAEVIKVLPVNAAGSDDAFSRGYYETWNRNKLGVTLDMSREEGIEVAKKLVQKSDVVIENFTPRVMANWELDYEYLKVIKPDIIMVSMSAMGQTGPDRNMAGFAPTVHASSGLTGLTASPDGEPTGPGFSYGDHIAGLYASIAVLGALEHRDKTGEGQFIDISQTEAVMSLLGREFLEYQMTGTEPKTDDVKGVTVQNAAGLFADPQLRAGGFFVDRPDMGRLVDASPIRMGETPAQYRKAAPGPGEDNDYVYCDLLGLTSAEIRELRQRGII